MSTDAQSPIADEEVGATGDTGSPAADPRPGAPGASSQLSGIPALPAAGPWPRYWARSLDLFVFFLAIGYVVVRLVSGAFANDNRIANQALAFALVPAAMVLDAVIRAIFGNTPGKWLCGIQVISTRGREISFPRYLNRNLRIYLFGLALGLPVISLFTAIHNHAKVSQGHPTSWDYDLETDVVRVRAARWRTPVTASAYILLVVLFWLRVTYVASLTPDDRLREWVAQINSAAPKMLDATTRLDGAEIVSPGPVLQYNYTLTSVSGSDQQMLEARAATLRPKLVEDFCTSARMQLVRDAVRGVRYQYSDMNGVLVLAVDISRRDCSP